MSEAEKLQIIVDTFFNAPVGAVTPEAVAARIVSYFGDPDFDKDSLVETTGGVIGSLLALIKVTKDLQFQVSELQARIDNDGK